MAVMTWRCCVLIQAILLLPLLKVLIIDVLFMALKNLKQFICLKILCLKIVGIYIKIHINEINIKNQVWNCYFNNSIKVKKLEFKNILINEKNHKDLVIHFTRYVHNKSIKTLRMQFGELIGKIKEHGGKNV